MIPGLPADHPRLRARNGHAVDPDGRCVVYWMQRAHRAVDNPALDAALLVGNELRLPVVAFLGVIASYPRANLRHYTFLAEGIPELAAGLAARGVGFVLRAAPDHRLIPFLDELRRLGHRPAAVIGDENPLRELERFRSLLGEALPIPLVTVDADVVVPSAHFPKQEWSAATLRRTIEPLLPRYLVRPAPVETRVRFAGRLPRGLPPEADALLAALTIDRSVSSVSAFRGGRAEGEKRLRRFLAMRLLRYGDDRNHPETPGTSELSAYLHFGQLGPREVAWAVAESGEPESVTAPYLEELIVRRELAVNFAWRQPDYDRYAGCPDWARRTLADHAADERPVIYDERALESAATHDPLWNAAQREMVATGRMHGYLRMYWAKKILEWSATPEEAHAIAVRQNDRWLLDGRDPNGYAGVSWAIGGVHDRPWFERPIFGTVRFMSLASTGKKFDSRRYIAWAARL